MVSLSDDSVDDPEYCVPKEKKIGDDDSRSSDGDNAERESGGDGGDNVEGGIPSGVGDNDGAGQSIRICPLPLAPSATHPPWSTLRTTLAANW